MSPGIIEHPREVLSLAAAHELIATTELGAGLLDVRVDGWSVWPVVRTDVITRLTGASFARKPEPPRKVSVLAGVAMEGIADISRYLQLQPTRRIFGTYTSGLRDFCGGQFRDTMMGEIIATLPDALVLEDSNDRPMASRRAPRSSRYVTTTAIQLGTALGRRLTSGRDSRVAAAEICMRLKDAVGFSPVDTQWLERKFAHFAWSRRLHVHFFGRVRPRQVVVGDWGRYGLIAAAHDVGAEVVELQHGVLDRHHGAYGWLPGASRYRELMPIADRLLLFGQYWVEELATTDFWENRTAVVGSVPIDRARAKVPSSKRDLNLVFTAQGIDGSRVGAFLRRVLQLLSPSARLVVKIHPIYGGDYDVLRAALSDDGRATVWDANTGPSTLDLIANSDVHASISSTCHYDAIALGVPTVILPFESSDVVLSLHARGHARLAGTPEELAAIVLNPSSHACAANIAEWYYARGAVDNIIRALGDV